MRFGTTVFGDRRNRRYAVFAIVAAVLSIALAPLHTLSALLSLPLTVGIAYVVCDILSHLIADREFIFPSKWGLNTAEERGKLAWTDHVLALVCGLLTVLGLFVFGELVDCVRGENVWRGEDLGLSWCSN